MNGPPAPCRRGAGRPFLPRFFAFTNRGKGAIIKAACKRFAC
ncbi:hypothetical protein HMPREF0262_00229 [Clostridium sp. ATCC 29733]|nr:hypothetical protein HMPREF0262_00229 [Clostridium sp. ATCC 29733]